MRGPSRSSRWLAASLLLLGCGGGPPRRPAPPDRQAPAERRETFEVRGIRDLPFETEPLLHGLSQLGGVQDVHVDRATGRFVVVYDARRTDRDEIHARIVEVGADQGLRYDPIFDDR